MVKCVAFEKGIAQKIDEDYHSSPLVKWIIFEKENDIELKKNIMEILNVDSLIIDDLLEEQRPNLINFENFSVAVIGFPKNKGNFDEKADILQVTFIISKKMIISICDEKNEIINDVFKKILNSRGIMGVTNIFSFILDKLVEKSVLILDKLEDELEEKEKMIFLGKKNKMFLFKNNDLKDNLYYLGKIFRSDLEVINDIMANKINFLNLKYFGEHLQDRFLYLLDFCESLREFINSINNNYVSMINFDTNNHIYKLTIIGSLLIIPSIISGFFGMNVDLPSLSFFEILIFTLILSFSSYFILRLRF
ncbi:MAG: CorA family divalent cation transporter [Candidatus Nanoarchaeia archaeon]|nr:CorA family divalent cation transporter [Candidatus Nanoarchaeia archaeon]